MIALSGVSVLYNFCSPGKYYFIYINETLHTGETENVAFLAGRRFLHFLSHRLSACRRGAASTATPRGTERGQVSKRGCGDHRRDGAQGP